VILALGVYYIAGAQDSTLLISNDCAMKDASARKDIGEGDDGCGSD
jgi:hypothetical protein